MHVCSLYTSMCPCPYITVHVLHISISTYHCIKGHLEILLFFTNWLNSRKFIHEILTSENIKTQIAKSLNICIRMYTVYAIRTYVHSDVLYVCMYTYAVYIVCFAMCAVLVHTYICVLSCPIMWCISLSLHRTSLTLKWSASRAPSCCAMDTSPTIHHLS